MIHFNMKRFIQGDITVLSERGLIQGFCHNNQQKGVTFYFMASLHEMIQRCVKSAKWRGGVFHVMAEKLKE